MYSVSFALPVRLTATRGGIFCTRSSPKVTILCVMLMLLRMWAIRQSHALSSHVQQGFTKIAYANSSFHACAFCNHRHTWRCYLHWRFTKSNHDMFHVLRSLTVLLTVMATRGVVTGTRGSPKPIGSSLPVEFTVTGPRGVIIGARGSPKRTITCVKCILPSPSTAHMKYSSAPEGDQK